MKLKLLAIALLGLSLPSFGQNRMCVFFTEKTPEQNPYVQFTDRALARRVAQGIELDDKDRVVNAQYIQILATEGKILNVSRWLNAVTFETAMTPEEVQQHFSFVKSTKTIGLPTPVKPYEEIEIIHQKSLDYGVGIEQVQQLNLDCLHNQGFTGQGIYLAIIDAGFDKMDSIQYFDNVYLENRILDKYNFVNDNTDMYLHSTHGTSVASCIVGEKSAPNQFAGTAIDVNLALYLAEDVYSETEIEEYNVVEALERADSVGADVVNISLGYFEFDDPQTSHVYADMDGNTTVAAQGVNVAFSRGIAVVSSAGNSAPGHIGTPCDADYGLCVGAVNWAGDWAFFSSIGPAFDGQVKPDVASRGQDAWVVTPPVPGILQMGNGTSFSSPIMAGAVACLRQASPAATVDEIFASIRQSASQYTTPDTLLGYGIPDFCVAQVTLDVHAMDAGSPLEVQLYPNPASDELSIDFTGNTQVKKLRILNLAGQEMYTFETAQAEVELKLGQLSSGMYLLLVEQDGQRALRKFEIRK